MKSLFRWKRAVASIAAVYLLSSLMAPIPLAQQTDGNSFLFGYPFAFFAVHVSTGGEGVDFSTAFLLGAFLGDFLVMYLICFGIKKLMECRKSRRYGGKQLDQEAVGQDGRITGNL